MQGILYKNALQSAQDATPSLTAARPSQLLYCMLSKGCLKINAASAMLAAETSMPMPSAPFPCFTHTLSHTHDAVPAPNSLKL